MEDQLKTAHYFFGVVLLSLLFLNGCSSSHKMRNILTGDLYPKALMNIAIGMSKKQVVEQIGKPDVVRGSTMCNDGQTLECWEYLVDSRTWIEAPQSYWLYFREGRLAQWGRPNDWRQETNPNHIQEIRLR